MFLDSASGLPFWLPGRFVALEELMDRLPLQDLINEFAAMSSAYEFFSRHTGINISSQDRGGVSLMKERAENFLRLLTAAEFPMTADAMRRFVAALGKL